MFLLFFYARKYTRKNVFEPGRKRKDVSIETQVRLTPNVRAFSEGTKMSSLLNEYKGFLLLLDTLRNINQIKM